MTLYDVSLHIVRSVYFRSNKCWNYPVSKYPYNTLYFVLDGDGYVQTGDSIISLTPGNVYLIPANTQFACWCTSYIEKLYIDLYAELLPGLDIFSGNNDIKSISFPCSETLSLMMQDVTFPTEELPHHIPAQYHTLSEQLFLKGILMQVLSKLTPEDWTPPSQKILYFKTILDDIESHLSASLRVSDIARKHNWNPSSLSRAFHKHFGCSIKGYIENLLSARLRQELLTTDKTIQKLATQYDFCDAYYLSTFFKRREGISPDFYRRQNRG